MAERKSWDEVKAERPQSEEGRAAYEDEARISAFDPWCTAFAPKPG